MRWGNANLADRALEELVILPDWSQNPCPSLQVMQRTGGMGALETIPKQPVPGPCPPALPREPSDKQEAGTEPGTRPRTQDRPLLLTTLPRLPRLGWVRSL